MTNRQGFGSGYILPNKQKVNQYQIVKCRVCNTEIQRNSIINHLKSLNHNKAVPNRSDEKYWNRNFCFDLEKFYKK